MVLIPRKRIVVVAIAQLVEPWIVIPVVVGSNPISHPIIRSCDNAKVAELVDALASGVSVLTDVGVQVPPLAPIFLPFSVLSHQLQIQHDQHYSTDQRYA